MTSEISFSEKIWVFLLAISKGPTYWKNGVHAITPDILMVSLIPITAWVSILRLRIAFFREKRLERTSEVNSLHLLVLKLKSTFVELITL